MKFDLLLKDAYLVDSFQEKAFHIAIKYDFIEKISQDINPKLSENTIYLKDKLAIPST